MKKRLIGMLALLIAFSMIFTCAAAMAAPEGESAESEAIESEGENAESEGSEEAGESADEEPGESAGEEAGESADEEPGESAGEEAGESAGEEAGESADGEAGGSGGGDMAGNGSPVSFDASEIIKYDPVDYTYIPAEEGQAAISTLTKPIIEVDGLKFRDLNENGELDIYEDWRQDSETRADDLISKMTVEEKARMLFQADLPTTMGASEEDGENTVWYFILKCGCTHFLNNNYKGTPDNMANVHNQVQAIAETSRLGIPVTITSDRMYNAWAGYIDSAHDAYGTAHNVELASKIWNLYSQEVAAVGIHVTLQPYSVEIGSWDGENPEYIAEMIAAEVSSFQAGGTFTCTKHFIARGGDSTFGDAQSIAANYQNFMYCWKSAIDAGTRWIMADDGQGITPGLCVDFDPATMDYLRNVLGFDGVVVTDWGAVNICARGTYEGVDIASLSLVERYAWMINNTVDQLGINNLTLDESKANGGTYYVTAMDQAIEEGLLKMEAADASCKRLLLTKFDLGLFDDPYSDPDEALKIASSAEFYAEQFDITNIDELDAARNPELVDLDRQLMAESAVLVKNDDNLLPFAEGTKVYFDSTASEYYKEEIKAAIGKRCELVDEMEQAEVIVLDCTSLTDAAAQMIEDAEASGAKIVIVTNNVDPDAVVMESGDAVLFMNYNRTPDHGTALNGFVLTTEPVVYADLLLGTREPSGMIVKEIARDNIQELYQWKDLAGDMGVNAWARLMLEAYMLSNDDFSTPENWGDPLLCYKYGMRYGQDPSFRYQIISAPQEIREVEEYNAMWNFTSLVTKAVNIAKAGEPFIIRSILWNDGSDGVTTAHAYIDGNLTAEKLMAVNGGSWRIVEFEIVIDDPGEHVIAIEDLTTSITIE